MHESRGRWAQDQSGGWQGSIETAWSRRSFGPEAADFIGTVTLRLEEGVAAGLLVRQVGNRGAVALLDAERQQVALCTVPRFQVVDARRWPIERGRDYRVRVVGNGEFIEVFLDDELVLQMRLVRTRGAATSASWSTVAARPSPTWSCWPSPDPGAPGSGLGGLDPRCSPAARLTGADSRYVPSSGCTTIASPSSSLPPRRRRTAASVSTRQTPQPSAALKKVSKAPSRSASGRGVSRRVRVVASHWAPVSAISTPQLASDRA